MSLADWMRKHLPSEVIEQNANPALSQHLADLLCACGWSEQEHDPAEHRPTLRCPCYLHYGPPMPFRAAWPCICECSHESQPAAYTSCDCEACLLLMPDLCDRDPQDGGAA